MRGHRRGHGVRERQGELGHEVGIGSGEVKRDRARRPIGDDSTGEDAAPPGLAPVRADDAAEVPLPAGDRLDLVDAFDRTPEVLRLDRLARRVVDVGSQPKGVGRAGVLGLGQRGGEVRDELTPFDAAHATKCDEAVVRDREDGPRSR